MIITKHKKSSFSSELTNAYESDEAQNDIFSEQTDNAKDDAKTVDSEETGGEIPGAHDIEDEEDEHHDEEDSEDNDVSEDSADIETNSVHEEDSDDQEDLSDNIISSANLDNYQSESTANTDSTSETFSENKVPYLPKGNKVQIKGWLEIKSTAFGNIKKFPELPVEAELQKIMRNSKFQRINPLYIKGKKDVPSQFSFYFRMTKNILYYTYDTKSTNIAGSFNLKGITNVRWIEDAKLPKIVMFDKSGEKWTISGLNRKIMINWFCKILEFSGNQKEPICDPKNYSTLVPSKILIKTVTQPLIIIPSPSKYCNTNWDYNKHGQDWECLCKEGKEQSPIDLPSPAKAVEVDIKPIFEYDFVDATMTENYAAANLRSGQKNKIVYDDYQIKIRHPNFGKVVTLDGGVYTAQEIVFKTPAEHKVEGNTYDMEMQIIHHGKTIGDTIKKVVLSFMFKAKPGVFNKFIDKLNFFDLPNPAEKSKDITSTLFIPQIFFNSDEDDISIMVPFSFYTYQGSLTRPPCNEDVIYYIASKPIELSNTAITLFKEALRVPDRMDTMGNVVTSDVLQENNRAVQPLYGRSIFHYDMKKYNCPEFKKKNFKVPHPHGHYEKKEKTSTEYVFVNGMEPSGIPNAYVVPTEEATGGIA
jgi:carbonic anhydrase